MRLNVPSQLVQSLPESPATPSHEPTRAYVACSTVRPHLSTRQCRCNRNPRSCSCTCLHSGSTFPPPPILLPSSCPGEWPHQVSTTGRGKPLETWRGAEEAATHLLEVTVVRAVPRRPTRRIYSAGTCRAAQRRLGVLSAQQRSTVAIRHVGRLGDCTRLPFATQRAVYLARHPSPTHCHRNTQTPRWARFPCSTRTARRRP